MRFTPNGQAVASFSVATNRRWTNRDSGETQEQVEFHDVVVWGKMAESLSQYIKKGIPVYVEGRIQTRNWEGQDGVKRYKTEIVAENIILLGGRGGGNTGESRPAASDENPVDEITKPEKKSDDTPAKTEEIDIDEIPF
jgi:single-strand DNA-binding protein